MLVGNQAYDPGSFHLLTTQTLTSGQSSVVFTSLNAYSDYQHFQLRITTRTNRTGADSDPVVMRFNLDSGANYSTHGLIGYNIGGSTAVTANGGTSTNHLFISEAMPVASSSANSFGAMVVDILDPFETTKNKTVRTLAGVKDAWSSVELRSGSWMNTTAVNSITILPLLGSELAANSRFSLYGIKAA
jgi:hypothetical protein